MEETFGRKLEVLILTIEEIDIKVTFKKNVVIKHIGISR